MTSWNNILKSGSGIYITDASEDTPVPKRPESEGLWTIDAEKCRTKESLFSELTKTLMFPSYFGNNWDAFDECLSDLSWLPHQSHLFIIHDAPRLLELGEDLETFVDILREASAEWSDSHPEGTFKVVLTVSKHDESALRNMLENVGRMALSRISYAHGALRHRINVWGKGLEFDPEDQIVMLLEEKFGPGPIHIADARKEQGFMVLTVEMSDWENPREFALLESGSLAW
jgi:RNAse (barnase) inhibitor barstar